MRLPTTIRHASRQSLLTNHIYCNATLECFKRPRSQASLIIHTFHRTSRALYLGPRTVRSAVKNRLSNISVVATCQEQTNLNQRILTSSPSRRQHTTTSNIRHSTDAVPVPYTPPSTGLLSYFPASWVPFAELVRLDKPVGTYYLFFPCLFSTLLAAPLTTPVTSPLTVLTTTTLFATGALIMRGAGCTINDLWDRNLDPHVARTRHRPIARGAITPFKAIIFTGVQLFAGLAILLQFPLPCLYYAVPSLLLVATYPLAKRVTNYPQFVLGLTFSWGAIMGFPALGLPLVSSTSTAVPAISDLDSISAVLSSLSPFNIATFWSTLQVHRATFSAAGFLYASNIAWTVLYDMIYAHMDIKDDAKVGIKSIARAHEANTKAVLSGLAVVQAGLLGAAGWAVGAGPVYFAGVCGSALLCHGIMIWRVRLKDVGDCWWWFRKGCWFTGGGIAAGLGAEYAMQYYGLYNSREKEVSEEA